jgi:phosphoglucosamine mutase
MYGKTIGDRNGAWGRAVGALISSSTYHRGRLVFRLQLLSVLKEKQERLSVLASRMERFPQVLVNARVKDKEEIMQNPQIMAKIGEVQKKLGENGRVLVRPSGTESLIRVMLEGQDQDELQKLTEEILTAIQAAEAK